MHILQHFVLSVLLALATSGLLYGQETSDSSQTTDKTAVKKADDSESNDQTTGKESDKEDDKTDSSKRVSSKKKSAEKETKKQEEKKPQVRQINLSGNYVDLVQPLSFDPTTLLLGQSPLKQKSFYRLCRFIDDLAEDNRYQHVVFDLSAASISMNGAQLEELSRHMKKLTDGGKKTYAWLENATNVHLGIAASCDEVLLADFGGVDMPSLAMQSMFYRDAMDLVGVKASVVRAGEFKGAVEPYTNPRMSDHLREHYVAMLTTMNDAMVDRLARGRGLKSVDVRELQQKRMLLPKQALAAGIVDQLAPFGSMEDSIRKLIGEEVEWVTPKAAAKRQVSVFQLMGQMMSGSATSSGRLKPDSICVLHLSGAIVDGKKAAAGNIVSGPTVALIEQLVEEDKVEGVVVRINSPGGSATASEAIRQALNKLAAAKPVVISMGNVAASGGYWISCIDAPVYAERETMTGSIGVFSLKLSAGALMRRVGVHLESITLDDSAGLFALDRSWSDADTEMLQGTIDLVYDRFLDLVGDARGIQRKRLEKLAGGRVWSGDQAKRHKLVDHIGGLDDCLALLGKKTKLGNEYNVIHRPVPRTGLDLSELLGTGGEEEIWSGLSQAGLRLLLQRGQSLRLTKMLLEDGISNRGRPTTWLLSPVEISVR